LLKIYQKVTANTCKFYLLNCIAKIIAKTSIDTGEAFELLRYF